MTLGSRLFVPLLPAACLVALSGCVGQAMDGAGGVDGGPGRDRQADAAPEEQQPEPAPGAGLSDPPTDSLHNHRCGGIDWQRIHGWLLLPHKAPEIAPADEIERCVERYAGWVTNEADRAGVSRASVYAALAASGQCDAGGDYDGALISGAQCVSVHPELGEQECLDSMASSRGFGIATLASALGSEDAVSAHKRDVPLMAAYVAHGSVECGGDSRWKLAAPEGFVDHYVAAYNGVKARSADPPACAKRVVMSVALYTGMDEPGLDGVAAANGCWTYERLSKWNHEWKLCGYDGSVHHPAGNKWVYDDTNTSHNRTVERNRIKACADGVSGRGYIDMANRGSGWPKVVTNGVRVHFAEIYSSQYRVDDQFNLWKSSGKPGQPMINVGEASTTAQHIHFAASRSCKELADGGFLGVYIYPQALRGKRMSALVRALNQCTAAP